MVSHHPGKFGDHKHCGSRDMMFLVVEGQDSICNHLNLQILFISKTHGKPAQTYEISGRRHVNLPICPAMDFRYWSHKSKTTSDKNY